MTGKGRGRTRKVRSRKSQQAGDTLADSFPPVTGVRGDSASQIPQESVENFDDQGSEHKAVKSPEVTNYRSTPLAPLQEPVEAFVPDLRPNGVHVGKRKPLRALQANRVARSPSPVSNASNCTEEERSRVQGIFDAIDAEVRVRSEAIKAIAASQVRSITAQLQHRLSMLTVEVRNMPLLEYLKSCPNIVAKETDDGRIQLCRVSPARDNPPEEPVSLFSTPALDPMKRSGSQFHSFKSELLSWTQYHAKLQASGHIGVYPSSSGPHIQQDSAMSSKKGLLRGVTPKTVRIPKEGEVLLSLNGSPLGQFGLTPGPNVDNSLLRARKNPGARTTRSTTKRSLRDL